MNNTFDELRQTIELSQSIAISGHISPDGDAIGACSALAMSLTELGKDVVVILDEYQENFEIIPTGGLIVKNVDDEYLPDLYIAVDCGDKERLGTKAKLFDETLYTINIDHHKSNTFFAKQNYVDSEASSASEIVFQLIYNYAPITADIAAAIYAGIVFDTGGFRHSSTSPVTMAIVSELMEYDFNFTEIYNSIFHTRSFGEARIMGVALFNLKEVFDGRIVTSIVTDEEIKKCGVTSDELSEVSSYIKGVSGTVASVFMYEKKPGTFKVSMRSDDLVDVSQVAAKFGGGGHMRASGCTIDGEANKILENILLEIEKQL
jgi:Exopolyphosphatase-related proteins